MLHEIDFLLKQDHCSSIANVLMMVAGVTESSVKMLFTSFFGCYFHKPVFNIYNLKFDIFDATGLLHLFITFHTLVDFHVSMTPGCKTDF